MNKYNIKTIVFDLGGVYFTRGSFLAIEKIAQIYNIKNINEVRKIFGDSYKKEGHLLRMGLISMDEFEERFIAKFKIQEQDKHHLHNIWFCSYIPHYKIEDIVKQLKQDYRLIIFSGNVKERVDFLNRRYDFLKYFDEAIFSYDYQKGKTDIEFYKVLLNHIKCKPSETVVVDDERKNIMQAESLGMNGLLFYYTEYFVSQLQQFGIKVNI